MAKFDRKIVSFSSAAQADDRVSEYEEFNIVAVVGLDKRLVFIFEKERGPGRPKKKDDNPE